MTGTLQHPVLLLGATGSLGARTVRMLRKLHPELPITIAARDMDKAAALAREVGHATTARIDITIPGLGLDPAARYSIVVTALRDHSFNSLRYAQAQGVPYMAMSDGVFELGPMIAHHVHNAGSAPILLLGHSNGGVPTLAALHFARQFETIEAIELGLLFTPAIPSAPSPPRISNAYRRSVPGRWSSRTANGNGPRPRSRRGASPASTARHMKHMRRDCWTC